MGLRLEPSTAVREKRLARLLSERGLERDDSRLRRLVEDALLVGSLGLAGVRVSWEEARASEGAPVELAALRRARACVVPEAPLTLDAIRAWHAALAGPVGFRVSDVASHDNPRDGHSGTGAPPAFVEDRLANLVEWLDAEGSRELTAEQKACVALARIVEIRPFDQANGRVSRLAAAHVLERAGLGPPILVSGDADRLQAALQEAFALDTSALLELVRETSGRALDVMIQAIERKLI